MRKGRFGSDNYQSFSINPDDVAWRAKKGLEIIKIFDIIGNIRHVGGLGDARNW